MKIPVKGLKQVSLGLLAVPKHDTFMNQVPIYSCTGRMTCHNECEFHLKTFRVRMLFEF